MILRVLPWPEDKNTGSGQVCIAIGGPLGATVGAGFGVLVGNVGAGIFAGLALGISLGLAFYLMLNRKRPDSR
jgi:hypothetical protein